MANVVSNIITVKDCNEDTFKFLESFFTFEDSGKKDYEIIKKLFDDVSEELPFDWMTDNCGAKWVTFEGAWKSGDDYEVNLSSAWSPANDWVEKFAEKIRSVQSDVMIHNKYIDEAFNSAGIYFTAEDYVNHHEEDMVEWDVDKLLESNDDDNSYVEEFYGVLNENLFDMIQDYKDSKE